MQTEVSRIDLVNTLIGQYPQLYRQMISEWQQPGEDAFWLLYSQNYLFRSGNTRWALDPMTLLCRTTGELPVCPQIDFSPLNFILLSHDHGDHIHWPFLRSIANSEITWVIPEFLLDIFYGHVDVNKSQVVVPQPGHWLEISGVKILPLEGNHWEPIPGNITRKKGLPSISYLFEFNQKRWFFPGDTRSYPLSDLPRVGDLDGLAAHVFLGRRQSPTDEPALLTDFCNYFGGFTTRRIILSHLYEIGREMKDIWTEDHAEAIRSLISSEYPAVLVDAVLTGDQFKM